MKPLNTGNIRTRVAALAAVAVLSLAAPALAISTPTDAWITTKVKVSLLTEGVDPTEVNVDTLRHQVTLHGTVHTAEEKVAAERAANAVEGVQNVRNLLQVVPAAIETAVEEKDEAIREHVAAALAGDASLKDSSITVQSVNNGVVLLQGNSRNLSDLLTALDLARGVRGVRRVSSEIQTDETLADARIWQQPNPQGGAAAAPGLAGAAADIYTTSVVKMRLLANRETPAMDINVDTRSGVVTLFGMVPTPESKAAAGIEAANTSGVTSVRNLLQVVPSARQAEVEATDEIIRQNVEKNLGQHSELSRVVSDVKNCVARLTGSVPSGVERVEAMQIARATSGVCSVSADLTIQ